MSGLLRRQFSSVEDTFLTSMVEPPEMESFAHFWSGLHLTVAEGIKQQIIDEETLTRVYEVAGRVNTMAGLLMDLYDKSDAITVSFHNDLAPLFADLSVDGQPSSPSHPIPPKPASAVKASGVSATLPPYIRPAYNWLLSNLHNPYPSKETKATIAEESGSSSKDVDNWFINVRRRIGWNKLRSKHFENKRSLIVDAATRFFKEVPQALPSSTTHASIIDPMANHNLEFKSIEITARDLYPAKLFEMPLVTKLDESGRDLTPETKGLALAESSEGAEELQRLNAYPTPERSPERSPEASVASLPFQDIIPASSRKRRNSDRDSLDIQDCCDEPPKRCRLDSNQLPVTRHQTTHQKNDCTTLPTPSIPVAPSGKRKRRLSDAGYDGPPKRPHNALAVPRLQAVSDPFPLANPIISQLYKTTFDQTIGDSIPSPVSVESLDDTQVEVDFYNYDTSQDIIQPFLFPDSLEPYPALSSLLSTTNSELLSLDKSQTSDPDLHFRFENYLKDLDTPLANLPSETASKEVPFFADIIPSHDHSTLFPFENVLPTQPPQEDLFLDPYFQIPTLWDFQGNGDNFLTVVPSVGTLLSSDLVPPEVDPIEKEKEAKRKQIEVLLAELQRLEAKP